MKKTILMMLLLGLSACDAPSTDLVLNCQKACAPRSVKTWTWDGFHHSAVCECEGEKPATWCDNVQVANGCPGPARLETLPHGALECHCDAWESQSR